MFECFDFEQRLQIGGAIMQDNFKPGGGSKPQPYIPAGNGERSGEYTSNSNERGKLEKA